MDKQEGIMQIVHNPKVGAAAATAAGGIGLGAFFSFFAPIIGFITAFLSAVLILVLIYKAWVNVQLGKLEMKIKEMKIKEQEDEAKDRKEKHLPTRRHTDGD